ncbi:MAG: hypothetical protein FJW30_03470 [Acidobacteria bacterium]|nr:hypothetical protein [Acidobacteriota bacterium]
MLSTKIRASLLALALGSLAHASTIVSVGPAADHQRAFFAPGTGVYSMGWSQTQSYTNVSIRVSFREIDTGTGFLGGEITGFLTSQVGAGTTQALHELEAPADAVYAPGHTGLLTVYSGLALGPGNYYFTVTPKSFIGISQISENPAPTVLLDSGVAVLGYSIGIGGSAYMPDSVIPWIGVSAWVFEVTGDPVLDPVAEPATWHLLLLAALPLLLLRRKSKTP